MWRWILSISLIFVVLLAASCSSISAGTPSTTLYHGMPITATEDLHITGVAPEEVDIENYQLTIDGLVSVPLSLTYSEITKYPAVSKIVMLNCPGFFVDLAEWTGVPLSTLFSEAGVTSEASQVAFFSIDGYSVTFPIEDVTGEGVFLAYKVNSDVLPLAHGYPLRLVVEGREGGVWIKWVDHIEIK
jgi:DMSO/TMAO reductase YedYZ molybdopterin-dependent catalytic subunit